MGVSPEDYWEFKPGDRVRVVEGFNGHVTEVLDGPYPGSEKYIVALDNSMGGGEYGSGELSKVRNTTAQDTSIRTAADDYPELGTILHDRPNHQTVMTVASLHAWAADRSSVTAGESALCGPCSGLDETAEHTCPPMVSEGGSGDSGDQTYLMPPDFETEVTVDEDGNRHIVSEGATYYLDTPESDALYEQAAMTASEGARAMAQVEVPDDSIADGTAEAIAREIVRKNAGWLTDKILDHVVEHAPAKYQQEPTPRTPGGHIGDWCRYRRPTGEQGHCWYSKTLNKGATETYGYAIWVPEDRGVCPRVTWEQQETCPIGEPGPHAPGGFLDATVPFEQGGQHYSALAPEFGFHATAAWSDVRAKAKKIAADGRVHVIGTPTHGSTYISADVQGDTEVYRTIIQRVPGKYAVATWECGCAWSAYSWGRTGRWRRFEGRMCSHALALTYEAQRREMFGAEMKADTTRPSWWDSTQVPKTVYDKDKRRPVAHVAALHRTAGGDWGTDADLYAPPIIEMAKAMMEAGGTTNQTYQFIQATGAKDPDALMAVALKSSFWAKVKGKVQKVVNVVNGVIHLADGSTATEVLYPTYDPHLGLSLSDRKHGAKSDPCPACSGTGEQGTGHECYACDSTGLGSEYSPNIDNANPENGLLVGRNDALGIEPVTASSHQTYWAHRDSAGTALVRHTYDPKGSTFHYYDRGRRDWVEDNSWAKVAIKGSTSATQVSPEEAESIRAKMDHESPPPANKTSMVNDANHPEARDQGHRLEQSYFNVEPRITPLVKGVAKRLGGDSRGLGFRIKGFHWGRAGTQCKDPEDNPSHHHETDGFVPEGRTIGQKIERVMRAKGVNAQRAAGSVSDALRYTVTFPEDHYAEGVEELLDALRSAGHTPMLGGAKNYWKKGDPYDGINITMMGPGGVKWELQAHTPKSFAVKQRNHADYEAYDKEADPVKRKTLYDRMAGRAVEIPLPPGARDISRHLFRDVYDAGPMAAAAAKDTKADGPSCSGVVLKAADTGRILMLQRCLDDGTKEKDPAAGQWEFPGGHHEDGDKTSLHAGIREWEEEVGHRFPDGGHVSHVWRSPNGIYQGHVVVVPNEDIPELHKPRKVKNPDGDMFEQSAWWDPDHARKNPALRTEVKSSPWDAIKKAAINKQADAHPDVDCPAPEHHEGDGLNPAVWDEANGYQHYDGSVSHRESDRSVSDWINNPHESRYVTKDEVLAAAGNPTEAQARVMLNAAYRDQGDEWLFEAGGPLAHTEPPTTDAEAVVMGLQDDVTEAREDLGLAPLADLHDEPEPALPTTDGITEGDEISVPAPVQQAVHPEPRHDDIVAQFQARAAYLAPGSAQGPSTGVDDHSIAEIAQQFLKVGLKAFSPAERKQIIDEGMDVVAGNFDSLDLTGTHYAPLEEALQQQEAAQELWM